MLESHQRESFEISVRADLSDREEPLHESAELLLPLQVRWYFDSIENHKLQPASVERKTAFPPCYCSTTAPSHNLLVGFFLGAFS